MGFAQSMMPDEDATQTSFEHQDGRALIGDEERLAALDELDILDTPPEESFDDVVAIASALCAAPIALVSLVERDRQWFKARIGLDLPQTPIEQSVCACGLGSEELLFANKLYRLWFGGRAAGHLQMVVQAGMSDAPHPSDERLDDLKRTVSEYAMLLALSRYCRDNDAQATPGNERCRPRNGAYNLGLYATRSTLTGSHDLIGWKGRRSSGVLGQARHRRQN